LLFDPFYDVFCMANLDSVLEDKIGSKHAKLRAKNLSSKERAKILKNLHVLQEQKKYLVNFHT